MNLIQSFWLDENTKYVVPEYDGFLRDDVRDQISVVMYRRDEEGAGPRSVKYNEPNEDGFYTGLPMDGRLDA